MSIRPLDALIQTHCSQIKIKVSLAQPDPYAGGEGLVTCCTRSCPAGMQ